VVIRNASLLSDSESDVDGSLIPSSSGIDRDNDCVVFLRLRVSVLLDESVLATNVRVFESTIDTARLRILVMPSVISFLVSVNYRMAKVTSVNHACIGKAVLIFFFGTFCFSDRFSPSNVSILAFRVSTEAFNASISVCCAFF
jgi:hypothetical protein